MDCWFPTGCEPLPARDYALFINPKYLIPQYFRLPDQLATPCISSASLPESVLPKRERDALFAGPQDRTPQLVWVRVTPTVRAWADWANRAAGDRGKVLLPFQRECCEVLVPFYVDRSYPKQEVDKALSRAAEHLRSRPASELLPQPDPVWLDLVRFGLASPWTGFAEWSARQPPPLPIPEPPPAPVATPTSRTRPSRSAKSSVPALF